MDTTEKIERIRKTNYLGCVLHKGEEWYLIDGSPLSLQDSRECMLEMMEYMKMIAWRAQKLIELIDYSIEEYEASGNLFEDILELGEALCTINEGCMDYTEKITRLNRIPRKYYRRRCEYYGSDDLPF